MEAVKSLSDAFALFRKGLDGYYPDAEIRSIFYLATEHLLNYSKIDIHLKEQESISTSVFNRYGDILNRLRNWEPVQYILGRTEFYGLPFIVDRRALIPRPETEELVDWIVHDPQSREADILDVGTGSGCIAISLAATLPHARVSACDISLDALDLAGANSRVNKTDVNFFAFDMRNGALPLPSKYRLIVSNPPYVTEREKVLIRRNVLDFEPDLALFVPDQDPLVYYRCLALLGRKYLTDGGLLYLEINEQFPNEVMKILQQAGFYGLEVKRDLGGKARMVRGRK
jgi:release factor glutamine methyltransferase